MLFSGDVFEVEGITVNRGSDGGQSWPQNDACNNHVGDLDAVDALLANLQNVTFWRHGKMDPVIADFFETFDNYVLVGSASN